MPGAFDNWLDGAPVGGSTVSFSHWLEGGPVVEEAEIPSRIIFRGAIEQASGEIPEIKLTATAYGGRLRGKHPRFLAQPTCNVEPYSTPCGLVAADWTFDATYVSASGRNRYTFHLTAFGGGAVPGSIAAGYFAGGRWQTAKAGIENVIWIANSGEMDGSDNVLITLAREPRIALEAGDAVTLRPHCGQTYAGCGAFSNTNRFRGFPHMPSSSATFVARPKIEGPSGKK